jgi:hypothetical protein
MKQLSRRPLSQQQPQGKPQNVNCYDDPCSTIQNMSTLFEGILFVFRYTVSFENVTL